jgi:U3 small nucleolar RNA-associated protein 12
VKSGVSSKSSLDSLDSIRILCHLSNNALEVHEIQLGKNETSHRLVSRLEREGHRSDVRALALSSDDELFASGAAESLKVWNVASGQCLHSFPSGYILTCAFLPGNRYVLAGTKQGDLELYDLTSGTLLETIEKAHEGPIWSLHMRPDKTGLVTGSQDKDVKFWDFRLIEDEHGQVGYFVIVLLFIMED